MSQSAHRAFGTTREPTSTGAASLRKWLDRYRDKSYGDLARAAVSRVGTQVRRRVMQPDPRDLPPPKAPLGLDLRGRLALVTGASGELGRPIARTLAVCGAAVALHYQSSRDRAEALRRELEALGARVCVVSGDVSSLDAVLAMRDAIDARLGPVDILVDNAITWFPKLSVLEQSVDAFEGMYRSCVLQAVITAKVFLPSMMKRGWGRIIAVSSEQAMQAIPNTAPYVSAKRGMDGVLRVLAHEIGAHQITVNQVAPGWIISDRVRLDRSESQPGYESKVALRRRGFDQDVANAVAFLASDLASFITGVYLPVSGGSVMPAI